MPLSWNEIKDRALRFSREWVDEASEDAEAKSFWDDFFNVFGVSRRRVANFERRVKKLDGKDGFIDLLWKGVLLIEHKSLGKDLDRAHTQARDYFHGLTDAELPRYLLVSDFARFRLYDLEGEVEPVEFALKDLHKHIRRFGFIAGYQARSFKEQDPVNVAAAERMGKLHDALKAAGYEGHALEVLLVRILFCLFADDTGIFPRHAFHDFIAQRTSADGADLGLWLGRIFQVLNTPEDARQKTLDELLAELPYVNGKLFEEALPFADFDAKMRNLLLDASGLDWSRISPAIFGSMFQSVMDAKARRNLGAHYTSEKNILKLIGPLFLDGLKVELDKAGGNEKALAQLHRKLATLKFFDPACGCGNFLVIAYREIRLLELEILKRQFARQQSVLAHVQDHVLVDVDQFFGIEIEEFPAQIAQVAMWLMDHQINLRVAEAFGENVVRLPLKKSAAIVHGNALRIDWNALLPDGQADYIFGNPPFVGAKLMTQEQREDLLAVADGLRGAGLLDFVCAWYLKVAALAEAYGFRKSGSPASFGKGIRCAFVSTNSIAQGEQVAVLWTAILAAGLRIRFAHRTFRWNNEARGVAAVHCVIIGFDQENGGSRQLFDYLDINGEPTEVAATNINPYLVDAPNVLLTSRSSPVCAVPAIGIGNKPIDGGYFLLTPGERDALLAREPRAATYLKRWYGATEFLNAIERYCLWLGDASPADLRSMPAILEIIDKVRRFRLGEINAKSGRESKAGQSSRALAGVPTRFHVSNLPNADYLLIPRHSSESRALIPMGFMRPADLAGDANLISGDATAFHFGVMQSVMHMAWVRTVCGRLKSDYRYSAGIVYNNFPWPEVVDDRFRLGIETAAQGVLDARAQFPGATLADLYNPLTMPPALAKAHAALDRAVDAAYIAAEKAAGRKSPKLGTDAERVAFLFERYQALTSLLPAAKTKNTRTPRKEA
ncbi:class I SAM-dependent DNA methyltransferase [Luteimonas sp. SDU101]|uniref:class I SAM-dependent DNA methyltransferase n=1 Tax=Luteimonas sp. SDU101 TaxID=3422593 RepID=UPI003EB7BBA4